MTTPATTGACTLCDTVKPDAAALKDHVLNVHPDEHCGIYHQQPCQFDRRERYMDALAAADPYALVQRRDDRARLADAVMAVADAEFPALLRILADMAETLRQFDPATGPRKAAQISENLGVLRVAEALRRMADEAQRPTHQAQSSPIDDPTGWAAGLDADGLEPSPDVLNLDGDSGPVIRVHFAYSRALPDRDRQQFALGLAHLIADNT